MRGLRILAAGMGDFPRLHCLHRDLFLLGHRYGDECTVVDGKF